MRRYAAAAALDRVRRACASIGLFVHPRLPTTIGPIWRAVGTSSTTCPPPPLRFSRLQGTCALGSSSVAIMLARSVAMALVATTTSVSAQGAKDFCLQHCNRYCLFCADAAPRCTRAGRGLGPQHAVLDAWRRAPGCLLVRVGCLP
jgi:hypothetical protein